MIQPKITVSELTLPETRLIWDALQQMSDNRVEDVDGEPLPSPVLDALLEKFDAMVAAPADALLAQPGFTSESIVKGTT